MIRIPQEICTELQRASRLEWLETNGLGGFAFSTPIGLNTRRYHGLLVAATHPPAGRLLLLSKLEETWVVDGTRYELSVNQYPGAIHPNGYKYLEEFRLDPFPTFTYRLGGMRLEKTIFMRYGQNTTVVSYALKRDAARLPGGPGDRGPQVELQVRPLIAFRDYHHLTHQNSALNPDVETGEGLARIAPYEGLPPLYLAHNAQALEPASVWHFNMEYEMERQRGLDFKEDLFNPMLLRYDLTHRPQATVIASTEKCAVAQAAEYRDAEVRRRAAVLATSPLHDDFIRSLVTASDAFVVSRGAGKTVVAGYPWFTDWGRDTMIALPGLTLVTGRFEDARDILRQFAGLVDKGMLPNRFPEADNKPEYNTVDATLWFFQAVHALLQYTADQGFVRSELYPAMSDILDWHIRGTRYGIHMDEDALLQAGEPGVQLTWMDAKIGDWVVTPRYGKPVEVQALWYNALRVMEDLAGKFEDGTMVRRCAILARQARRSFNRLFWNDQADCLYDVVDGQYRDASIRPNQVLALSLAHPLVPRLQAVKVLAVVRRDLLTPYGLRTLAPSDRNYCGRCAGDAASRDKAYHQGTVWAWWMGPFITAHLRVHGSSRKALRLADQWLEPLQRHLSDAGLGSISEVFDGDPPHEPRGCVAQAWSVAEVLRAAVERVFRFREVRQLTGAKINA